MNILDEHLNIIKSIAKGISKQFGNDTEVVIHDFRGDYSSTIIAIENGHVTGREVGGCPTNLWLEDIKNNSHKKENFGYLTHTKDGKILRSSTINFHDDNGNLIGAICINQDISDMIQLEKIVNKISISNQSPVINKIESHVSNVNDLLEVLIAEGLSQFSTPVNEMNKEAKLKFIEFLDSKGFFLIQKSGKRICDLLSISKFTLYNYLDIIRNKNN